MFPKPLTSFRRQISASRFCRPFSDSKSSPADAATPTAVAPRKYDPKDVTKEDMQWRSPWHKEHSNYYSFLRSFYSEDNRTNVLKLLHSPIDLSPASIKKWWLKKKEEQAIINQAYIPERNQVLGNELAAAHFIVHRGGAVKFYGDDQWIKADEDNKYSLPRFYNVDKKLEAIDCTDMNLFYEGLANLRSLEKVRWLSLNSCKNIDDWCMDKISNIFSHSLVYLDLRNCTNVTTRGLGALYRMENLKILLLDDFWRSTTYEMTCLLLQEVNPELDIRSDPVTFEIKRNTNEL